MPQNRIIKSFTRSSLQLKRDLSSLKGLDSARFVMRLIEMQLESLEKRQCAAVTTKSAADFFDSIYEARKNITPTPPASIIDAARCFDDIHQRYASKDEVNSEDRIFFHLRNGEYGVPLHRLVANGSSDTLIAFFNLLARMVRVGISAKKIIAHLDSAVQSPLQSMFLRIRPELKQAKLDFLCALFVRDGSLPTRSFMDAEERLVFCARVADMLGVKTGFVLHRNEIAKVIADGIFVSNPEKYSKELFVLFQYNLFPPGQFPVYSKRLHHDFVREIIALSSQDERFELLRDLARNWGITTSRLYRFIDGGKSSLQAVSLYSPPQYDEFDKLPPSEDIEFSKKKP